MLTPDERRDLVQALRQFPAQLETLVNGLTNAQLNTHFLENEWTVRQNVHHVADSHMNAYIRTKWLLTKDHPTIVPYDQDQWALMPDVEIVPIAESLTLLHGLHARMAAMFEALTDEQFARTGFHPENGELTVEWQLRTYVRHGNGHLDQIQRTLAAERH